MATVAPAFFLGVLVWAGPALADPTYDKCIAGTSTNSEWARCGSGYLKRLDRALNVAWKKAVSSLGDEQSRAQLLKEERAWISFKDASCQLFANGHFGREGQVVHFVGCRAAIIKARIADLNGISALAH